MTSLTTSYVPGTCFCLEAEQVTPAFVYLASKIPTVFA